MRFDVSVGDDGLGADNLPFGEVEPIKQDGNLCLEGDIVEALLPIGLGFARAFRSNAEPEGLGLFSLLCYDVGRVHLFATIDGYSAKPPHQDAHGPEEPFLLHQEVTMKAFGPTVEVADNEVPVARVRSKGYDAFFGQRFRDGFREVEPAEQNLVTK